MIRMNTRLMAVLASAGILFCACSALDSVHIEEPVSDLAENASATGLPEDSLVEDTVNQATVVREEIQVDNDGEEIIEVLTAGTLTPSVALLSPTEAGLADEAPVGAETPEPVLADIAEVEEEEEVEEQAQPPCLAMRFVTDVTVPDGTVMPSEQSFTKIWRVQNIGTCTWESDYTIRYHGGFQLGAPSNTKLGESVPPGQYINIGLQMNSPLQAGSFHGDWIMVSSSGDFFGIGENYDKPFCVEIIVSGPTIP